MSFILLAILSVAIVYKCVTAILLFRNTKIPGPWHTNLTNLVLHYHEFTKNRRLWIHSLHEKYGPVVRLAPDEVSFNNQESMKEIYQSGGSGYEKTEFYDLFMQYGQRTMFSTLNRYDHSERKRLFADRYAMTNIVKPEIMDAIQLRSDSVIEKCKASVGTHLDVYITLHCYALDCASLFLFNPSGTDTLNNPGDLALMEELTYHDSLKQRVIQHRYPRLSSMLDIFQHKSTPLSKGFVLHQADLQDHSDTSLIYKLQSKASLSSSTLQTIQMAAECMDHMAAGIDTTGDGLCFLMYELSSPRSQHIQSRLRQELLDNPTAKVDSLPYLDAVIREGLRVFPPIPMSFPRYVPGPDGRVISGYQIPAGTTVSCQPYSLHFLNEDVWGAETEKFMPERWLDTNTEPERIVEMNRLFFSFGGGGRGCIGRNLALMEMKTLLRDIYSQFRTTVAPEMKGDMTIDDQIIASRPKDQTCLLRFEPI